MGKRIFQVESIFRFRETDSCEEFVCRYEFRQNEFVCTAKTVSLHSKSRANGMRDFIAVGTTVYRGEDLSAKGGVSLLSLSVCLRGWLSRF